MAYVPIILAISLLLGTCGFALRFGLFPERALALIVAANIPLGIANTFLSSGMRPTFDLTIDAATAFIVMGLALKFPLRWLGVALLLYAAQFGLDAFYFVSAIPYDRVHAIIGNAIFFSVTVCLLVASIGAFRCRRREADLPAKASRRGAALQNFPLPSH